MTEADEIRRNADAAEARGDITHAQRLDVELMLLQDEIEKLELAKYLKGQTK